MLTSHFSACVSGKDFNRMDWIYTPPHTQNKNVNERWKDKGVNLFPLLLGDPTMERIIGLLPMKSGCNLAN
jgi:hypothetical protein